jgi:argininosuccinate lyase
MYRKKLLGEKNRWLEGYASSMDEDREIAHEVIEVLIAHVNALRYILPKGVVEDALRELERLVQDPSPLFAIEAEDVHEAIEVYLSARIEGSGYVPLGRSRNDHVAAALRLKVKRELEKEVKEISALREVVLSLAEKNLESFMPLFTHTQPAQPSTFAHYLCAIDETLSDYIYAMKAAVFITDKSPLGSGAVASTSVPLNREEMAEGLFSRIAENSLYATSSRDFLALACSVEASLAVFFSRIASDVIFFSSLGYVSLAEEHLATSSMMPQKKNAVTMEVTRAWGGEAMGHLMAIMSILKSLSSGYSLDIQEINKHALSLMSGTEDATDVLRDCFEKMRFNKEKAAEDASDVRILATDIAEAIALREGVPYREAHQMVAEAVKEGRLGEEARRLGVNLEKAVGKDVTGSPSPNMVLVYIRNARKGLDEALS